MSSPISNVTQAQPVQSAAQTPAANPKASASATQQAPSDTVTISNAAQTVLQEAQETHSQTLQEANAGDNQAKNLLAEEAAATAASKG